MTENVCVTLRRPNVAYYALICIYKVILYYYFVIVHLK